MLVGVVTDSTCDLPAATLRRVRVEAVPLRLAIGEELYHDWRDIEPATLYEWLEHQGIEPEVKAPDPEDFMQAYRRTFQRYESLVSIHVSRRFSRTLEHAREAARRLGIERNVTFVDSGYAGAGLAEVVLEAARSARRGASADEVVRVAESVRDSMYGVLSPTAGSWGSHSDWLSRARERRHVALRHRQIVAMERGSLSRLGWTGEKSVERALAVRVRERFGDERLHVTVAYGGTDQDRLAGLRSAMETAGLRIAHGRVQLIGPVMGTRLGPGAAAVFARPAPGGG